MASLGMARQKGSFAAKEKPVLLQDELPRVSTYIHPAIAAPDL